VRCTFEIEVMQNSEWAASLLPQRVFNSYSKAYNKRLERTSTPFEGPYQVIHIEEESHLLHLCRYTHANPVKDGLMAQLEEWPYSITLNGWTRRTAA
jgi:hypothetical protein